MVEFLHSNRMVPRKLLTDVAALKGSVAGINQALLSMVSDVTDLSGLDQQITDLTGDLTAAQQSLADTEADLSALYATTASLGQSVTSLGQTTTTLGNSVTALNAAQTATNSALTSTNAALATANGNISTLTNGLSTANNNIAGLTAGATTTNNNVAALTTALATTNSNVTTVNNTVSALSADLTTTKNTLTATVSDLNVAKLDIAGAKADIVTIKSDLATAISNLAALTATVNNVLPLGPFTVATLPAPTAANLGRLAIVSDLFTNRYTRVRCERINPSFYYWQPQSSDSYGEYAVTGNMTLAPLSSPTTVNLTGTLLTNITRTITLDPTGGWPGATKEFHSELVMGLGAILNFTGTGLSSVVSMITGGYRKFGLGYVNGALAWKLLT